MTESAFTPAQREVLEPLFGLVGITPFGKPVSCPTSNMPDLMARSLPLREEGAPGPCVMGTK